MFRYHTAGACFRNHHQGGSDLKAIIGGTGIDQDPRFKAHAERITSRYGDAYAAVIGDIVYLARHKPEHSVAPHRINYRANIQALRDLGVEKAVSIYAVGSITRKLAPSRIGIIKDFIDFTYGRENSFADDDAVVHTPMVNPFDASISAAFARAAFNDGCPLSFDNIYVTTNGPRLETAAEIESYRRMGADVVGMTLATEAELMIEAGISNAAVAFSINWAAGLDHEGVSFLEDETIARISKRILGYAEAALA